MGCGIVAKQLTVSNFCHLQVEALPLFWQHLGLSLAVVELPMVKQLSPHPSALKELRSLCSSESVLEFVPANFNLG